MLGRGRKTGASGQGSVASRKGERTKENRFQQPLYQKTGWRYKLRVSGSRCGWGSDGRLEIGVRGAVADLFSKTVFRGVVAADFTWVPRFVLCASSCSFLSYINEASPLQTSLPSLASDSLLCLDLPYTIGSTFITSIHNSSGFPPSPSLHKAFVQPTFRAGNSICTLGKFACNPNISYTVRFYSDPQRPTLSMSKASWRSEFPLSTYTPPCLLLFQSVLINDKGFHPQPSPMGIPITFAKRLLRLNQGTNTKLVNTALGLPHTLRNITAVKVTYVQFLPLLLLLFHRSNQHTSNGPLGSSGIFKKKDFPHFNVRISMPTNDEPKKRITAHIYIDDTNDEPKKRITARIESFRRRCICAR